MPATVRDMQMAAEACRNAHAYIGLFVMVRGCSGSQNAAEVLRAVDGTLMAAQRCQAPRWSGLHSGSVVKGS